MIKSFRLIVHQKHFSGEELIVNGKDYPTAQIGDILEIYHPSNASEDALEFDAKLKGQDADSDEDCPRLLLQIKAFADENVQANALQKDSISVEQSIALIFGLQAYMHVAVRKVDPQEVALDSVELTFKDQYISRSEMWRLKKSLVNSCPYIKKPIEFCGATVRCQVYEMWSQGDRVACGAITDDTKVVFRSSTSMVYLFLQMSSEMWHFDVYGDLYFEKAVNGFLADLFAKWKKNGCNHEVTIVLFSRTFYEANSLEEFPSHMRECLQHDYKGRYYEDFYRVAVQNERYDDWSSIVVQLWRVFDEYLDIVLGYHKRPDIEIPKAHNSTAKQGNFLEVLNISLNVFEKHYLDRSFERTGQLSVVITPGVGVFEVDRELTNITKQRIIDNGVGSDLVCVGEQPLHAVPLLKFHSKESTGPVADDYSLPHWINLSFYSSTKRLPFQAFVPRIKVPPLAPLPTYQQKPIVPIRSQEDDDFYTQQLHHNSLFDYDAYDAQVFQLPPSRQYNSTRTKSLRHAPLTGSHNRRFQERSTIRNCIPARKLSHPDTFRYVSKSTDPISIPRSSNKSSQRMASRSHSVCNERDVPLYTRRIAGSAGSPPLEPKALVNPFDPSHVTIKLTSNRRRWSHIFPKGPTGVLIQQHHYQAVPTNSAHGANFLGGTQNSGEEKTDAIKEAKGLAALREYCRKKLPNSGSSTHASSPSLLSSKSSSTKRLTLIWGATGEQEWTPALTTDVIIGVDWKSLIIPACLPITTDYFPDKRALHNDYLVSLYSLIPDSVNADFVQFRSNNAASSTMIRRQLSTMEVFNELISQRLAQGFQLILVPPKDMRVESNFNYDQCSEGTEEIYFLSVGRLFHKLSLYGNTISVTRYRPRHPYPGFNFQYRYRFHAPHHDKYEESFATFTTEKLEHYNWNYLDHYICTGGDTEFVLVDALKYWRFRIYLLPMNSTLCKRMSTESDPGSESTLSTSIPLDCLDTNEQHQLCEGILKFVETCVNRLKRTVISNGVMVSACSSTCSNSSHPCSKRNSTTSSRMPMNINTNNGSVMQLRRNSMSNFSHQVNSTTISTSPMRTADTRSSSKVVEKPKFLTQRSEIVLNQDSHHFHDGNLDDDESSMAHSGPCLKSTSTYLEVLDAMCNPANGFTFVMNNHHSLPATTFITADAVQWLIKEMDGVSDVSIAMDLFTAMHMSDLILHASGSKKKTFTYGFHLFYIVNKDVADNYPLVPDLLTFSNEFVEIEIDYNNEPRNEQDAFVTYQRMRLETDITGKSDRLEWGHIRYQTMFRPDQAFEFILEWLTSSGPIIAELLSNWCRKTQAYGLQMIPIPHDPLSLPYSTKSDPLRAPIYVPLHNKCLQECFDQWEIAMTGEHISYLQTAIVQRFGFMRCLMPDELTGKYKNGDSSSTYRTSREQTYVHSTGMIFILVSGLKVTSLDTDGIVAAPNVQHTFGEIEKPQNTLLRRFSQHADNTESPHEAYITRHVSGKNKDDYDNSKKLGFLWSWNHMMTKRWRNSQFVEHNNHIKLLKNFRDFCSDSEGQLKSFVGAFLKDII